MKKPSPTAHLIRLAAVFAVGFVVFVTAKSLATPATWNHDMANWFRLKSLDDMKKQVPAYANDNAACAKECHEKINKKLRKSPHKGTACDSCHGALADHIDVAKVDFETLFSGKYNDEQKTSLKKAAAPLSYGWPAHLQAAHEKNGGTVVPEGAAVPVIVKNPVKAAVMWQCRNCHLEMINKPATFKQFRLDPKYKKHNAFVSGQVEGQAEGQEIMCLKCHDPHDPTP